MGVLFLAITVPAIGRVVVVPPPPPKEQEQPVHPPTPSPSPSPREPEEQKETAPLPVEKYEVASDEVLLISKESLELYPSEGERDVGKGEEKEGGYWLTKGASFFSKNPKHVIMKEECRYRFKTGVKFAGHAFDLDKDPQTYFEVVCGDWDFASGITVDASIFPSELEDSTEVQLSFPQLSYYQLTLPIENLKRKGNWKVIRKWGDFQAGLMEEEEGEVKLDEKISSGPEAKTALQPFLKKAEEFVELRLALEGERIGGEGELPRMLDNLAYEYHGVYRWIDALPKSVQEFLVEQLAPLFAKLAIRLFDKDELGRYLTNLDWEKDVWSVNPDWYNDWPTSDKTKMVWDKLHTYSPEVGLSQWDVRVRMFWQRRGPKIFNAAKQAVLKELAPPASN